MAQGSGTRVSVRRHDMVSAASREPVQPLARHDFRSGLPDLSLFPRQPWLVHAPDPERSGKRRVRLPDPSGAPGLRAALASYINRARATVARADRIVVCGGASQGIDLICRVLRDRGARSVAIEDPGPSIQVTRVEAAGLVARRIPVDDDGIMPIVSSAGCKRGACHAGSSVSLGRGACTAAPHGLARLGRAAQRARDRGRLPRRVPLRSGTARRDARPCARSRRIPRHGQQDPGAWAAARLVASADKLRGGACASKAAQRSRLTGARAGRIHRISRAREMDRHVRRTRLIYRRGGIRWSRPCTNTCPAHASMASRPGCTSWSSWRATSTSWRWCARQGNDRSACTRQARASPG